MEQTKLTRFKRILLTSISVLCLLFCLSGLLLCHGNEPTQMIKIKNLPIVDSSSIKQDSINNIKKQLVEAVDKYISTKASRYNKNLSGHLVNAALEHDIDLCFMMAQTEVETCFGTTGAGRESSRRSLFGVAKLKYDTYERAIQGYCILLKTKYLVKGRTEQHLLKNFVTGKGARYARNPRYEKKLATTYNRIKKSSEIYSLQNEYKNMI